MRIIKATQADISRVMEIFSIAVKYMQDNGNPTQWQGGYPFCEVVESDILLDRFYLVVDDESHIVAQFCFFVGDDPTYEHIDGTWLNDERYGVVHRLASSGKVKGVAQMVLDWCFEQYPNIRIDTHADNSTLQHVLRKGGYVECGEIMVSNGTMRVAFQRTK